MAILYGTMQNGQLVAVEADSQGRLVAQLANPVDPSDFVAITGSTMTGNLTVPSLNSGPLSGFRNQLINGDFRVWQRGTSRVLTGSNEFGPDRWKFATAATVTQVNSSRPEGASCSMKVNTGGAAPQYGVELPVNGLGGTEGPFTVGSQWTLSVWCDQDITGSSSMFRFRDNTGSATNQVEAAATIPNWQQITTVPSNGFHRYAITVTITGAPAASNRVLNINLPSPAAADHRYALVQLEPGPVATPFEHRPIGTELALCQRYYEYTSRVFQRLGAAPEGQTTTVPWTYAVTKRTIPTIEGTTDGNWILTDEYRTDLRGTPDANGNLIATDVSAEAEL
jgi:hypothetical protein